MTTHHINSLLCPFCGAVSDAETDLFSKGEGAGPTDGDAAVCWACQEIAIFAHDGGRYVLRRPNMAEALILAHDPRIPRVQRLTKEVFARIPTKTKPETRQ